MRRTAISQRWLPQVRRLLTELEARLEENERAETARWRQLAADLTIDRETE
jgi:vacuolar-type H+-ATPase subunit D/Vma8